MKALSIRQPWAWLVVHGGKDVENRCWNTSMRDRFLIHAAKGMTRQEYDDALDFAYGIIGNVAIERVPPFDRMERGGIVGSAELFDVIPPHDEKIRLLRPCRWHIATQHGFRLRCVKSLPFTPCRGALGFWGNFDIRDGRVIATEAM